MASNPNANRNPNCAVLIASYSAPTTNRATHTKVERTLVSVPLEEAGDKPCCACSSDGRCFACGCCSRAMNHNCCVGFGTCYCLLITILGFASMAGSSQPVSIPPDGMPWTTTCFMEALGPVRAVVASQKRSVRPRVRWEVRRGAGGQLGKGRG